MQHLPSHKDAAGNGPPKSGVPGKWFPETLVKEPPPIISPRSLSNMQEDTPKGLSEKSRRSVSFWE